MSASYAKVPNITDDGTNQEVTIINVRATSNGHVSIFTRYLGLILMAMSALVFSLMSLLVSVIGQHHDSFEIMIYRSAITSVLCIVSLWWLHESLLGPAGMRSMLMLRATVGFVSMSCFYYGLTQLSLGDATVCIFTMPQWTALLAYCVLGEPWGKYEWIASLFSMSGVTLVARPQFLFGGSSSSNHRVVAIVITIGGAMLGACTNVIVRHMGAGVHYLVPVTYFSVFSTLAAPLGAFALQTFRPPSVLVIVMFFGVGVLGYLGQSLKTKAFQVEKAGRAAMMRNLDVIFSFIFQAFVLQDEIRVFSLVGALLILASSVLIGVSKWRDNATSSDNVSSTRQNNILCESEELSASLELEGLVTDPDETCE